MANARILLAAAVFSGMVFSAGFLLGALREVMVRPYLGPDWSRLAELPLMIAIVWYAARLIVGRFAIVGAARWRHVGLIAFAFVLTAEALLGWFALRISPLQFLVSFGTWIGFLSLLAQATLIVFPELAARRSNLS